MSLDRSLKSGSGLSQHRSVLTRAERIAKMKSDGTFAEDASPLGLPKTLAPRLTVRKKVKKKVEEGAEGEVAVGAPGAAAPAATAATPAAGGKGAPAAAKGAAPAGKGAAPAGKGAAKK